MAFSPNEKITAGDWLVSAMAVLQVVDVIPIVLVQTDSSGLLEEKLAILDIVAMAISPLAVKVL